ncbi:hypothetical protein HYT52_04645 [Candidatus Woesearchaeota archaeon]|nr:hypothetical protein [Candidatus Woesearchaeota archaeon]
MPLSYWLTAVALFHKEAYSILQEVQVLHGFEIQSDIRDIDYFKDLSLKLGRNRFYLDLGRLQETIDFLLMDKDQTLSHGDIKLDNLWGKSLVDLDNLALRPVAIDLGGLFSSYRIPKELWGKHLEDYKALSGIGQMPLERAVIEGVNYSVTKEVFGSSSRRVTPLIERRNAQLLAYRDSILAA